MNSLRLLALLGLLAGGLGVRAQEREFNLWPFRVQRYDAAGRIESFNYAGPLVFSEPAPPDREHVTTGGTASGFRPFWVQATDATGDLRSAGVLYPIFSYSADAEYYHWSVFQLINRTQRRAGTPATGTDLGTQDTFDIWPFWFSRTTGAPASQYRGLFPIYGTVRGKLGSDRIAWMLFPLYAQTEKRGTTTTYTPWPFIRTIRGSSSGFAIWPLFGWQERPGVSRSEFWLWPFGYRSVRQPSSDDPAGTPPTRRFGVLPFYDRASGPGYFGEDFLWPFFGHTERTAPLAYQEKRYFWPFLVQGRGPDHYVNRWGPFYTHSVIKGYDKTWYMWPVWRQAAWTDGGVAQTKSQFLWFVYWSQEQRSLANPRAAPASLAHVWPFYSGWDNGAGRRQWQAFSPLAVFFPQIEQVNRTWSPLFAVARHDQTAPGETRTSLLWNGITWQRSESEHRTEVHVGPLVSVSNSPRQQRVALGNGLLGMKRQPGERAWRLFWLDFPPKPASVSSDRR